MGTAALAELASVTNPQALLIGQAPWRLGHELPIGLIVTHQGLFNHIAG